MIPSGFRSSKRRLNRPMRQNVGRVALFFFFLSVFTLAQDKVPELRPLPPLRLGVLENAVQEQLRAVRDELEKTQIDPASTSDQLADAYGGLGQLLHAYELYEAAENCYFNARHLAPEEFRWNYYLGVVLHEQGRSTEAIDALMGALSIQPDSIPALVRLGAIFLQAGELGQAEESFSRAAALDDSAAAGRFGLGQVKILKRNYFAAIEHLEAALALSPEANLIHYSLGMAYRGAGDMESAQRHLSRSGSVGVRPADPLLDELPRLAAGEIVAALRGRRAFNAGRYEDAVSEFRRAVAAAPKSARSRTNLAASLAEAGRPEEAIVEFWKAIELNPEGAETARFNLARLLIHAGRPAEAVPLLQFVVSLRPSDRSARIELARAMGLEGDFEAALEVLAPALAARPPDPASALLEVDLLTQMGREESAKESLEALQRELPQDPRVLHRLARLLAAASDPGVREPRRSLELARQLFDALPTLENAEAIFFAHLALDECPEAESWLLSLGNANPSAEVRSRLKELRALLQLHSNCRSPVQ